jgi:hypothetical protein
MGQQENMNRVWYCRFVSNKTALRPEVKSDFQRRRTFEHPLKLDLGEKKLRFILQSSCIYRSQDYKMIRNVCPTTKTPLSGCSQNSNRQLWSYKVPKISGTVQLLIESQYSMKMYLQSIWKAVRWNLRKTRLRNNVSRRWYTVRITGQ